MSRFQRVLSLVLFLVVFLAVAAVFGLVGALGPVELLICAILAVPIAAVVWLAVSRRGPRARASR